MFKNTAELLSLSIVFFGAITVCATVEVVRHNAISQTVHIYCNVIVHVLIQMHQSAGAWTSCPDLQALAFVQLAAKTLRKSRTAFGFRSE